MSGETILVGAGTLAFMMLACGVLRLLAWRRVQQLIRQRYGDEPQP